MWTFLLKLTENLSLFIVETKKLSYMSYDFKSNSLSIILKKDHLITDYTRIISPDNLLEIW